ncbi:uncharacterized protein BDR25DRAFT_51268 [Lindgomyces ingoldianus]|uniref:Uncharacterized protein n=1 Tax=Lindgomyces ingoldianus TaxID=673940 RepID=A0ACB6QRE0_9PLEO|nr:uncharacterized protein BDR25DRAFT_51268 [Lindgomyces ingoldianus]KAF2469133.1 hypothetical protein BDR25DRAFT_51268 [Lindgomyces ingoldianus]
MCSYRYIYYSRCRHAEFIKVNYCDRAKELGWPQWDSTRYLQDQLQRHANAPGPSVQDRARPSTQGNREWSRPSSDTGSPHHQTQHYLGHPQVNGMATSSEHGLAHSWADDVSAPDDEANPNAYLIPRSTQTDVVAPGHPDYPASHEYHHHASLASCARDTEGGNMLEIGIPMNTYSSISMELRHQDDDACTRASSSATVRHYESDVETLRGSPASLSDPQSSGLLLQSSPARDTDQSIQLRDTHSRSSSTFDFDAGDGEAAASHDADYSTNHIEQGSPRNPRKPIPPQWAAAKSKAPVLSTAKRALERESRKKTSHTDLSTESRTKLFRGARSSVDLDKQQGGDVTTFLTKDAAAAVDGDITSSRASSTIRCTTSKATIKSPAGSPLRDHTKHQSSIKITASPSRTPKAPAHGPDLAEASASGRSGPSSISSGYTPFETAKHSPISEVSSYMSALESLAEHVLDVDVHTPDLRLADKKNLQEAIKTSDGKKTQNQHRRGKSEPHFMAPTAAGKATQPPKLSLKIPHSKTLATDRKPHFTLGSAASSASVSPGSPSSSRIPRKAASSKTNQESGSLATPLRPGLLKRAKSAKSLSSKERPRSVAGDIAANEPASKEPCDIPLPTTPGNAVPLRHVKTLDSKGTTPIISRASPVICSTATSTATTLDNSLEEDNVTISTTPTDDPLLDKHLLVTSYLEKHVPGQGEGAHPDFKGIASAFEAQLDTLAPFNGDTMAFLFSKAKIESTGKNPKSEDWVPGVNSQNRDTRVASDETVKALQLSSSEDYMLNDPAIVFSRKKSESSGAALSDTAHEEISSVTSAGTEYNRTAEIWRHTSPVRGRKQQNVSESSLRRSSQVSLRSNVPSHLRATAPDFVPQQQDNTATRPNLPTEWTNTQAEPLYGQPFALDPNGIPYFYGMYPVALGPGTVFDYTTYRAPSTSPSKKKGKGKKKFTPNMRARGRDQRNNPQPSPTKGGEEANSRQSGSKATEKTEDVAAIGDATPRPAYTILAQGLELTAGEVFTESSSTASRSPTPFRYQLETITRQTEERPAIDWSAIPNVQISRPRQGSHNTPQAPLSFRGYGNPTYNTTNAGFSHYTMPAPPHSRNYLGRYPYRQQGGNGLYDRPGYSYGYSGRNRTTAAAGVPLNSTTPFPNPVPPPGPPRSGTPKEYLGYSVGGDETPRKPSQTCRRMDIVMPATEMVGGISCNKCEPDH